MDIYSDDSDDSESGPNQKIKDLNLKQIKTNKKLNKKVEIVKKKLEKTIAIQPKIKVNKKKSVSDEFDLEGQFEKLVYEDIIYIHNLENNKIFDVNNKEIGTYKNKKISWSDDEYKKQHSEAKDNI